MSTYTSEKIYSTQGPRYMQVTGSQTTNGSVANTSTINWTLTTAGDGTSCYSTGPTYLWIAGVERYYKARVEWNALKFPARAGSTSGSFTLAHNEDGSIDPIVVKFKSAIYTGEWNSTTKEGTWTLDSIARYFSSTPTISLSSRTETSFTYNWSTSESCKKVVVYYKKSSASNYSTVTAYDDANGATSGSFTLSGLSANTTYNVYIKATRKDSGMVSDSAGATPSTYNYPHITKVGTSNLTIGGSQTLTLYNPLKRSVTIKMYQNSTSGTLLYTSSATTGESITFTPTAANLYSSIPSAQSSYCVYSAVCSSPSYTNTTGGNTYSYKVSGNEKPVFSDTQVSTYDATSSVTSVTGQTAAGGWLVQSLSQLKVTIDSAATPQNSSSISKYEVIFGGVTKTLSVGTTGGTWGTYNSTGEQTVTIKVTDSRGLITQVTKKVTYVAYRPPSISLSGARETKYADKTDENNEVILDKDKIILTAIYSGADVSGTNGVKVSWSGASQSGYFTGSSSSFDTTESGTKKTTLEGLDTKTVYTFTATIIDKFGKTASISETIPITQPAVFIDVEREGMGIGTLPEGSGLYIKSNLKVGGKRLLQGYEIDLSGYLDTTFYPVLINYTKERIDCEVVSPSAGGSATWNQNAISFSYKGTGWSDTPHSFNIYHYGCYDTNEITIGCIGRGQRAGWVCVWVRGGMKYKFFCNQPVTAYPTGVTKNDEIYMPGTNYYGGTNTYVTIMFTPQSTITEGLYFDKRMRVKGNLKPDSLTVVGDVSVGGNISCTNNISASKSLFANNGYLTSVCNGKQIKIGCENSNHTHYVTDANTSHWFNKTVQVAGQIMKGSNYNLNVPAVFIQSGQPTASQTGDIWFIT